MATRKNYGDNNNARLYKSHSLDMLSNGLDQNTSNVDYSPNTNLNSNVQNSGPGKSSVSYKCTKC